MEPRDHPQLHAHPRFHAMKGSAWQALGWLTADRHVEAAGAAEHELLEAPTAEAVAETEHQILLRYGEAMPARPSGRY